MARKKRTGKREGYGLPFAVLRGIVRDNRFAPPANRDPSLRLWAARVAQRLSLIDKRVWALNIDWKSHACTLDQCARKPVRKRAAGVERTHHARIAHHLRAAANLLRDSAQTDPLLIGTLHFVSRFSGGNEYAPFVPSGKVSPLPTPRLSDFLKATADMIEGERVCVHGLHESTMGGVSKIVGTKGAAIEAAAALRQFFIAHTGAPHDHLMAKIVAAYYPGYSGQYLQSTLEKRASSRRSPARKRGGNQESVSGD